ncbi:HisA/HisF-related TIM barrel protein [Desertimonas flava]|uniref:1-(5-phosphoribosyl)-5-[(5- phosphoribosylamino)methylideneamino]imidazole-4- carboxamide isomerase n=1 Tax=Desertimonas flava TaxID=2064846 RepID=UPI000E34C215|nr:1-(5-phosphoribosyl)-5-[(5-phosphoribosylamino)methylideneamino] imidazole-4-carboxamide isomerase [Desertimonas flava]
MTAKLYPSIDLRNGKVVRLIQGDYADQITYDVDPVSVARSFCDGGTSWIHIVDLDAARSGERLNTLVIAEVVEAVAGRASVQVGGGVRSLDDAAALADAGVTRVVMGSAAVADPSLVDVVADRVPVAVGLDHRAGVVAVHGWTEASELTVDAALSRFPAASAFVITDISRDGMLAGPDIEGLAAAVAATPTPVVASGGVGSLDDIAALSAIEGLGGIITGRALYEGRFTVAEAIARIGERTTA